MSDSNILESFIAIHDNFYLNVLDIGAANHKPTLSRVVQNSIKYCAIEPDKFAWPNDKNRNYKIDKWFDVVVSREERRCDFFRARKSELSSLRRPNFDVISQFNNPGRFEIVQKQPINVTTIDRFVEKNDIGEVDYMKIDVQGVAYECLEGATEVLEDVQMLAVELEVKRLYENQYLMWDVLSLLDSKGFSVLDMRPIHWMCGSTNYTHQAHGQIVFYNALLYKTSKISAFKDKKREVARMFLLLKFGFYDLAYATICSSVFRAENRYKKTLSLLESKRSNNKFNPFLGSRSEWGMI